MKIDVDKCCITRYPANVLRNNVQPITEIDDDIRQLAEKMVDIMVETKGIGLAAPQAGVGLAMFVMSLDGTKENARAFINPKVEGLGKMEGAQEGCLSLPGIWPTISRAARCKVTATDIDGNEISYEAEGLEARCLQHEYDHLQGKTIAERMSKVAKIKFRNALRELEEKYADENG